MKSCIVDIFINAEEIESFRTSVISLGGNFIFDSASMIDLGTAYFERYPDRFSNRNTEEVLLGYSLVRICTVEKMVEKLEDGKKESFRSIFADVSKTADTVAMLVNRFGRESVLQDYRHLSESLQGIKDTVDEIPRGMIKERFVGGISNLFNILYVLKMNIDKSDGG